MKVIQNEDGYTYVTYREDKRPLKLAVYVIDDVERGAYFERIESYVKQAANAPVHLANMEQPKFYALVERLATMVCREYAPTANWGVTKPEIRGAVYYVLSAAIEVGTWPDRYVTSDKTFVQVGGDYDE